MRSKRILPLILIGVALLQACTYHGGYVFNSKKLKSSRPGYDLQEEIHFHIKINLPEKPVDRHIYMPGPIQYTWILSDSTIIYVADKLSVSLSGVIEDPNYPAYADSIYNNVHIPWIRRHHLYEGFDAEMDSIYERLGHKKPEPPSPTMIRRGTWNGHHWLDYTSYPDKLRCGYFSGNRLDTTKLKETLSSLRIMENYEVDLIGGRPPKERPITMELLNSGGIELKFDFPDSK